MVNRLGLLSFINMVTMAELRVVHICLAFVVVLVFTAEYAYISSMWRRPEAGYRALLWTLGVFALCSESDIALGEGFFLNVPRAAIVAISVNFAIFEQVMYFKRKAFMRMRATIETEHALVEDLACEV